MALCHALKLIPYERFPPDTPLGPPFEGPFDPPLGPPELGPLLPCPFDEGGGPGGGPPPLFDPFEGGGPGGGLFPFPFDPLLPGPLDEGGGPGGGPPLLFGLFEGGGPGGDPPLLLDPFEGGGPGGGLFPFPFPFPFPLFDPDDGPLGGGPEAPSFPLVSTVVFDIGSANPSTRLSFSNEALVFSSKDFPYTTKGSRASSFLDTEADASVPDVPTGAARTELANATSA